MASLNITIEKLMDQVADVAGKAAAEKWDEERSKAVELTNDPEHQRRKHASKYGFTPNGGMPAKSVRKDKLATMDVEEMTSKQKLLMAARSIRYIAACGGDLDKAMAVATATGQETLHTEWEKALTAGSFPGGGALIPPEFVEGVIEELGAKSVVRASGVGTVPMPNGTYSQAFIDDSASAAYTTEGQNILKTENTQGRLELSAKKLAAILPLSNDLLTIEAGPRVDTVISNHLVRVMRRKEDVTFIRSSGSSGEPRGMLSFALAANKFNSAGTSVVNITSDIGAAELRLLDLDVDLDAGAAWYLAPRSWSALMAARDGNNNLVWKPELAEFGTLLGYPVFRTSQIPKTLDPGGDKSEVYLAGVSTLLIGETDDLRIEMFPAATYFDGTQLQSALSRDETVMRAIARHDFGPQQRGKEIAVIEQVAWTP